MQVEVILDGARGHDKTFRARSEEGAKRVTFFHRASVVGGLEINNDSVILDGETPVSYAEASNCIMRGVANGKGKPKKVRFQPRNKFKVMSLTLKVNATDAATSA